MHHETRWNVVREFPSRHVAILVLAFCGVTISIYLTLYQYGAAGEPWDPIFGSHSSERVLDSALSRALPVHDGVLGIAGYSLELLVTGALLARPARLAPVRARLAAALGVLTVVMGLVSIALICIQAFVVVAACTLCLASALISLINAVLALPEERRAFNLGLRWVQHVRPAPHGHAGSPN